ncbi:DUF2514 domain-containing protein [Achromobacter animicus]|uniref:DUF2514 domain-containing protein n=1 Tax=Achromobacter animicus TaxID=1389935 RepID=UPI00345E654E
MSLFRNTLVSLTGWKGYAVAVGAGLAAGALAAGGGAWTVQGWRGDVKLARVTKAHAHELAKQAQATVAAVEAARTEERRRVAAVEKARDDATKQAALAVADAAHARSEHSRLLVHANTLARAAVDRDPSAAVGSAAGSSAVDLLAFMLGRVSVRATELAAVADRARIAGLTCERAYDVLRYGDLGQVPD